MTSEYWAIYWLIFIGWSCPCIGDLKDWERLQGEPKQNKNKKQKQKKKLAYWRMVQKMKREGEEDC